MEILKNLLVCFKATINSSYININNIIFLKIAILYKENNSVRKRALFYIFASLFTV